MPIRGVLLDVGGVVFVGDGALDGAVAAVGRLKAAGIAVRCITNTTRQPRCLLVMIGDDVEADIAGAQAAGVSAAGRSRR